MTGSILNAALVGVWEAPQLEGCFADGDWRAVATGGGRLIYTADGFVAAVLAIDGELVAYSGRYEVVADGVVHHVVDVSRPKAWSGTVQQRRAVLAGDELVLETPPGLDGGGAQQARVRWRRVPHAR
jgi:Lipocalin-like domain